MGSSHEDKEVDFGKQAKTMIEAADFMGDKKGLGIIVKFVRGANDDRLWERFKASPLYGKGKGRSEKFWTALSRQLILKGLLKDTRKTLPGKQWTYSEISVTDEGSRFIYSSEPLLLRQTGELKLEKPKSKVAVEAPK